MHHRPLPAFPSLSGRLVQEYDAERSDEVHRHARIHRKGAIDEEQRAPQEGSDHAASVESTDEPRPITKKRFVRGTYIRDNADAIPHAVPRTLVPKISGVHLRQRSANFPLERERET